MGSVRAVLIDLHGVLTVSWQPLPGAVEALREIRATGLGVALVTNTTSRTRASIAGVPAEAGSRCPPSPPRIAPSTGRGRDVRC